MTPPPADRALRPWRHQLDELLSEGECSALVVAAASSRDSDMAHFVGRVHLGDCLLVVPRGRAPRLGFLTAMERAEAGASGLDLMLPEALDPDPASTGSQSDVERWSGVISRALELAEVEPGPVAVAGNARAGLAAEVWQSLGDAGWQARAGNSLVRRLRKEKRSWQVDEARVAARGVCEAMRGVAELLAAAEAGYTGELYLGGEPLRVARLRREISRRLAGYGLHEPEGNIVAAGRDGGIPHSQGSSDRVLRAGETLVVDLYPRDRVFADCTRTFCVGQAVAEVRAAHAAALEALRAAHVMARPGARGWDLQEETCRRLEAAGYSTPVSHPGTETGYVHNLGHGVGLELHEYPSFRRGAGAEGTLAVGDLLTLEPGLYDPEAGWGLRLENLVYLGSDGNEILTPLPYELDPRAWNE